MFRGQIPSNSLYGTPSFIEFTLTVAQPDMKATKQTSTHNLMIHRILFVII